VTLYERLITTLGGKMAPALQVEAKKPPLIVARRSFAFTKTGVRTQLILILEDTLC
jgi:hypothetical protein